MMQKLPSARQPVVEQRNGSRMLYLGAQQAHASARSDPPGEGCAAFALQHCDAAYTFCTPAQLNASPVLTTGLYTEDNAI